MKLVQRLDAQRDPRVKFIVGGSALLSAEDLSQAAIPANPHFRLPWAGPFPVVAVTPSTVTLDLPEHLRLKSNTFHIAKVRPYNDRPAHLGTLPPPPGPVDLHPSGVPVWELARIVNHCFARIVNHAAILIADGCLPTIYDYCSTYGVDPSSLSLPPLPAPSRPSPRRLRPR